MKLKGMDKLREKLPAYPGRRIFLLPIRGLFAAIIGYCFLILLDIVPRLFGSVEVLVPIEPFLPILGSLLMLVMAHILIGKLWRKRDEMKAKYGDLAYQRMIQTGVIGVFLVPPLVFHQFTSIRSLPPGTPVNPLTVQWSQSLLPLVGTPLFLDILLRVSFSGFFILLGALTVRSSILTFGIDYMTVVYLYFPEESEIQEHEIYSVVRHPAYFGGVLLGLAGLAFRFSVYSILIFLIVYATFWYQTIREERELIQRFGDSFQEYRTRVPRLHISVRNIGKYFRFLKP
ncbi:MAG: hypothetical protein EAX95_10860 [Candidatus Thorarchaeota archaeon]|nr:hypothetical protein [Candidatus Thorarchaeota archaeon]